jgi:hypothetical protein
VSGELDGVTHILHWVPGYLVKGGCTWGDGTWELQEIVSYLAGEPLTSPGWDLDGEPRDIEADDFTEWIASLTGFRVTVEKSSARITCPRALRFRREEPVWLVRPTGGAR